VEISDNPLNFLIDCHLSTLEGIARQILGRSETAREKESIEIFGIEFIYLLNITSGDSCRFH
jgi:ribosome biogenesis protein Tsr3